MQSSTNGGWVDWQPQGGGGKFDKYQNQLVIIVSRTEGQRVGNRVTKFSARVYLTDATMKALGNPNYVKISTRGSNVGIMATSEDDPRKYVVGLKQNNSTPFISATSFVKAHNIAQGAYNAHLETGVIVFDTREVPSKI